MTIDHTDHHQDAHPCPPVTSPDGYICAITPDGRVWDAVNGEWELRGANPQASEGGQQ